MGVVVRPESMGLLVIGTNHRQAPIDGVQFHPESILTTAGKALLRNFLDAAGLAAERVAEGGRITPSGSS